MARVLVTGGCGFVGRHLVKALQDRGDEIRVVDLAPPSVGGPHAEYIRGSITDAALMDSALKGVDRVYHLAGIPHLWAKKRSGFDIANRQGTEAVMAACMRANVPRVVHCSTESILLPKTKREAVDESLTLQLGDMPGPYTRSKFQAEVAAMKAAREGLNVTIVNPTVPVGAGDDNMTPPAQMLALFLKGGTPFFLDCVLNLVDVRDAADGMILAGDKGAVGERYILGGENVRLRDLLRLLEEVSGRRMPTRTILPPIALAAGVVSEFIANNITRTAPAATLEGILLALRSGAFDNSKARRELGYSPRPVDTALRAELEWLASRNNAEQPTSFGHEASAK
ncbi:NAD-dependent epimerase/dehydratase family protein [Flaviflagellibacter deserti]|jgi:dihydroflavonol-4-reductase|uniref:NAD-dependent epimerase/dehydratase family protein n=1 Tax=Flaviflagellibacter deserti TaxID=2267266 RepID=A0ABV9YXX5_9HYPH